MSDVRVHAIYEWNNGRIEETSKTLAKDAAERHVALAVRLIDVPDYGGLKSVTIKLENVIYAYRLHI